MRCSPLRVRCGVTTLSSHFEAQASRAKKFRNSTACVNFHFPSQIFAIEEFISVSAHWNWLTWIARYFAGHLPCSAECEIHPLKLSPLFYRDESCGFCCDQSIRLYCPSPPNHKLTKSTSVKPIYGWRGVTFNEVVDQIFTKPPIREG